MAQRHALAVILQVPGPYRVVAKGYSKSIEIRRYRDGRDGSAGRVELPENRTICCVDKPYATRARRGDRDALAVL